MNQRLCSVVLAGMLVFSSTLLHAHAKAKFLLTPTTETKLSLTIDETATIQYTVLNQTKITRTLAMVPLSGISQVTSGSDVCPNPFTLEPNKACLLTLRVNNTAATPEIIVGGPEVCKTISADNNAPDSFLCSQPETVNRLLVARRNPIFVRTLSVSPSSLSLTANGAAQQLTVTNHSLTLTATNIAADFSGTALAGNVIQDASDCVSVAPTKSCTLTFTPGAAAVTLASFPIKGDRTRTVGASIEVLDPGVAIINVAGSPLVFDINSSGFLTVTNTSTTVTATNISADLTGTALAAAGVTQVTTCASVPPGGSCTLTFTSHNNTAVPSTSVIIQGTGGTTSQTSASISVNAPLDSLTITAGSPLTLPADGETTGTMTIQNTGTQTALNINANFSGTALNGFVAVTSNTCASVAPGATCKLTYTPDTTPVPATDFTIQGSNTGAAVGTITLSAVPRAYFTNGSVNPPQSPPAVLICPINTSTGNPGNCTDSGLDAAVLDRPSGITFNSAKTYAYIVNNANNSVTTCTVNQSSGALSACIEVGSLGLSSPLFIAINPAGTYAYVTNSNQNLVSKCSIDPSNGRLTPCTASGATLVASPTGIVLNAAGTMAYIGNAGSSSIGQCEVSNINGSLSGCVTTPMNPGIGGNPYGLAINSSGTYVYAVDFVYAYIIQCTINSMTGYLDTCFNTGSMAGGTVRLSSLAINSAGTIAYVINSLQNAGGLATLSQCPITQGSGTITTANCKAIFSTPLQFGVALLND